VNFAPTNMECIPQVEETFRPAKTQRAYPLFHAGPSPVRLRPSFPAGSSSTGPRPRFTTATDEGEEEAIIVPEKLQNTPTLAKRTREMATYSKQRKIPLSAELSAVQS
jgi:hypothetical protein